MTGTHRWTYRALVGTIAAAAGVAVAAAPAFAHVTVNPGEAEQGGFTVLNFRVPNERDDAGTVELAVQFPTDNPIPFVSVRAHDGWTYEVTRATLPTPVESHGTEITEAVSVITWRAEEGVQIQPGEYDEFSVSVGPLPEVEQLIFPAVQTYTSGEVVRWIEEPPAEGAEEPEHPAPVLRLTAGGEEDTAALTGSPAEVSADAAGMSGADTSDGTARALGWAALAVAVVAAGLAGFAAATALRVVRERRG